jgi:glycosyltransferase involved in cell wall biosynthesis
MKILQLTNKIPYPPKDGGAIATLNISLGLHSLGHEITLLGMNTSKHYTNLDELPDTLKDNIDIRDVKVDTEICHRAMLKNLFFSRLPYNAVRFFNEDFAQSLTKLLQEKEFDVIQLEGLYMSWYIKTIREHSKALISLRAHNIEHEIWERTAAQERSLFKRFYFRELSRRIKRFKMSIMNSYDLLLPITKRDASKYFELGNTRPAFVVPAGYDVSHLNTQSNTVSFPDVFFIGTLDWFPNQEGVVWFLEKVWDNLVATNPGLRFHVAGRNAPLWLEKLLLSKEGVVYHGEIDDAHTFIRDHAIMIAPLFSGSGMRVKVIEGMALGKTIVTTTIGAEGIPVTDGENILIEDDPAYFASKVNILIKNKELFDEIGHNATQFVGDNFDNHKISASLADFYQKQLKKC